MFQLPGGTYLLTLELLVLPTFRAHFDPWSTTMLDRSATPGHHCSVLSSFFANGRRNGPIRLLHSYILDSRYIRCVLWYSQVIWLGIMKESTNEWEIRMRTWSWRDDTKHNQTLPHTSASGTLGARWATSKRSIHHPPNSESWYKRSEYSSFTFRSALTVHIGIWWMLTTKMFRGAVT